MHAVSYHDRSMYHRDGKLWIVQRDMAGTCMPFVVRSVVPLKCIVPRDIVGSAGWVEYPNKKLTVVPRSRNNGEYLFGVRSVEVRRYAVPCDSGNAQSYHNDLRSNDEKTYLLVAFEP